LQQNTFHSRNTKSAFFQLAVSLLSQIAQSRPFTARQNMLHKWVVCREDRKTLGLPGSLASAIETSVLSRLRLIMAID
jgi:hypothetical protein